MTLEEAKSKKKELEEKIGEMLEQFQTESGLTIDNVRFRSANAYPTPYCFIYIDVTL